MYDFTNNDHIVKLQTKSAADISLLATTTKLPKRAANVVINTHGYFFYDI